MPPTDSSTATPSEDSSGKTARHRPNVAQYIAAAAESAAATIEAVREEIVDAVKRVVR